MDFLFRLFPDSSRGAFRQGGVVRQAEQVHDAVWPLVESSFRQESAAACFGVSYESGLPARRKNRLGLVHRLSLLYGVLNENMMKETLSVGDLKIDGSLCIRCQRCVKICLAEIFYKEGGRIRTKNESACIFCGHCVAICPKDAIIHPAFPSSRVHSFAISDLPSPEQLMLLLKSRRSNRAFSGKEIPEESFRMIMAAAAAAPTAQNSRDVHFVLVRDPEVLKAVTEYTLASFMKVVRLLDNRFMRLLAGRKLADVYELIPKFKGMSRRFHAGEGDMILRGAKAVLFIYSSEKSRFGAADCNLAYQNASLMAESLGVAQFYTGFVLAALERDRKGRLNAMLGLKDVKIHAGMALAMPEIRFEKYVDRCGCN